MIKDKRLRIKDKRLITFDYEMQKVVLCHSPASLVEGGGGKGAGWYTRHQAAKGIKEKGKNKVQRNT